MKKSLPTMRISLKVKKRKSKDSALILSDILGNAPVAIVMQQGRFCLSGVGERRGVDSEVNGRQVFHPFGDVLVSVCRERRYGAVNGGEQGLVVMLQQLLIGGKGVSCVE